MFRSCTWREAEELLRDKEPGEEAVIIRPSSQGWSHLNISWKLTDTVCVHTGSHPNLVPLSAYGLLKVVYRRCGERQEVGG